MVAKPIKSGVFLKTEWLLDRKDSPVKAIIGLVGRKGSGKGTFSDVLMRMLPGAKIEVVRSSGILLKTLELWGIPSTRKNLQKLAVLMESFGSGSLSEAVRVQCQRSTAEILILDSIRWESDENLLRSYSPSLLVSVEASARCRYDRVIARGEKHGEASASFEQFLAEENAPNEVVIPTIAERADIVLLNDSTREDFATQIKSFVFTHLAALL